MEECLLVMESTRNNGGVPSNNDHCDLGFIVTACEVVRRPSRGHEVAMEDLRSKGVEGYVVPPLTQVRGRRGDQLMLKAGGGERIGKWMSACWFWRAPKKMGARPHLVGGLVISSFSSCS